jgi:hypothetical protein
MPSATQNLYHTMTGCCECLESHRDTRTACDDGRPRHLYIVQRESNHLQGDHETIYGQVYSHMSIEL